MDVMLFDYRHWLEYDSVARQFSVGAGRFFIHILDNDRSIVK